MVKSKVIRVNLINYYFLIYSFKLGYWRYFQNIIPDFNISATYLCVHLQFSNKIEVIKDEENSWKSNLENKAYLKLIFVYCNYYIVIITILEFQS